MFPPLPCLPLLLAPLTDGICQTRQSGDMSVPLQLLSHYSSPELLLNGILEPVVDLDVGYMVHVRDTQDLDLPIASHHHGLPDPGSTSNVVILPYQFPSCQSCCCPCISGDDLRFGSFIGDN